MRVFLSYASVELPMAMRVAQALRNEGLDVFFAPSDILVSEHHHGIIEERVGRWADVMICLLSKAYLAADYTTSELSIAKGRWASPAGRVLAFIPRDAVIDREQLDPYLRESTIAMPGGDLPADVCREVLALRRRMRQIAIDLWRRRLTKVVAALLVAATCTAAWRAHQRAEQRGREFAALKALLGQDSDHVRPWCRDQVSLGAFMRKGNDGNRWRSPCPIQLNLPSVELPAVTERSSSPLGATARSALADAGMLRDPSDTIRLAWTRYEIGPKLLQGIASSRAAADPSERALLMQRGTRIVTAILFAEGSSGGRERLGYQLSKLCWDSSGRLQALPLDRLGKDDCPEAP